MMNRRATLMRVLASLAIAWGWNSWTVADEVPRYWLKVGQELSYRTMSEFSAGDGSALASESTWQVWVVKQNSDGGWRLILRHAHSMQTPASPPNAKPPAGKAPPAKPAAPKPGAAKPAAAKPAGKVAAKPPAATAKPAAPSKPAEPADSSPRILEQVTFAYCDFSPDGAITPNPTLGFQLDPRQLLLKLPKNKSQIDKGWSDVDKETQVSYRYRVESQPQNDDDEPSWTIIATRQSPVDDVYLSKSQLTFRFNADLGLVERVEAKLEQDYGIKGTGVTTTELTGTEQFDDAWCRKLDEEMALYFGVQRRYQALLQAAQRNSAEAETLLVEAGVLLQKAGAEITLPVVKEDLGKQVAMHAAMIGLTARAARDRADLIDQPAPTWQTKDLQGNAHTLREYKGKVAVLHFWRRSDGWSLRTLSQIEQLAEEFADQPVVVLGMNADTNEEDAKFVADRMGLAYPMLRADKFAERYNAGSVSEVVVVDQQGVVRDVYAGYSPSLREEVAKVVRGLLAPKPAEE
ncbi:MAG TPA: redoxin domain-containing protein [Pirellulales bacterium]|nr:redoxin domain-containing protein [Pirellulales bacterium]